MPRGDGKWIDNERCGSRTEIHDMVSADGAVVYHDIWADKVREHGTEMRGNSYPRPRERRRSTRDDQLSRVKEMDGRRTFLTSNLALLESPPPFFLEPSAGAGVSTSIFASAMVVVVRVNEDQGSARDSIS